MATINKAKWNLEYRREGKEIRILLDGTEIGRVNAPECRIFTVEELEKRDERIVREALMAASALAEKESERMVDLVRRSDYSESYIKGFLHGQLDLIDFIDPRVEGE